MSTTWKSLPTEVIFDVFDRLFAWCIGKSRRYSKMKNKCDESTLQGKNIPMNNMSSITVFIGSEYRKKHIIKIYCSELEYEAVVNDRPYLSEDR